MSENQLISSQRFADHRKECIQNSKRRLGLSHTGGDSRYGGKRQRQATAQAERQIHATNVCTRTLATRTQQFSACWSIYGKSSTREDKSSKWLHPANPPIMTILWCCFAAGVDAGLLRSVRKGQQKRRTVWS